MTADNLDEVAGYESQAREFLVKGREYLSAGDLHQASEKGWGAAAHMAKVASAQGWRYSRHGHFHSIMNQAQQLTGSALLRHLHGRAEILHINYYDYYDLKDELNAETIGNDIEGMAELIEILYPLTGLTSG